MSMKRKIFLSSCILALLLCSMSTNVLAEEYGTFKAFPNVGHNCLCLSTLDDEGNSGCSQIALGLRECAAKSSQMIGQETGKDYSTEYHSLQFQVSENVLDVSGDNMLSGGEVIQWPLKTIENSRDNQLWTILNVEGFYQIKNKKSGLCLTANDNSIYTAALLQTECLNSNRLQLWDLDNLTCPLPSA